LATAALQRCGVTGVIFTAGQAISASKRIPADMSAVDAAHEFCYFMFGNLKQDDGKKKKVPHWFAENS
jgi:hypothetical protein